MLPCRTKNFAADFLWAQGTAGNIMPCAVPVLGTRQYVRYVWCRPIFLPIYALKLLPLALL